jgi:hypothetical protein
LSYGRRLGGYGLWRLGLSGFNCHLGERLGGFLDNWGFFDGGALSLDDHDLAFSSGFLLGEVTVTNLVG